MTVTLTEVALFIACLMVWLRVGYVYGRDYGFTAGWRASHFKLLHLIDTTMAAQKKSIDQFKKKDE